MSSQQPRQSKPESRPVWNALYLPPSKYAERSALLDTLFRSEGAPEALKRTILPWLTWGRDPTELERRVQVWRQFAPSAPLDDVLAWERWLGTFVGTPDEVIERLRSYAEVGMQEINVPWWVPEDIEGLRLLSEEIVPYVQAHD